jgi:precorrin isomerase
MEEYAEAGGTEGGANTAAAALRALMKVSIRSEVSI